MARKANSVRRRRPPYRCRPLHRCSQRSREYIIEEPHRIQNFAHGRRCFRSVSLAKGKHAVIAQVSHDTRFGNPVIDQIARIERGYGRTGNDLISFILSDRAIPRQAGYREQPQNWLPALRPLRAVRDAIEELQTGQLAASTISWPRRDGSCIWRNARFAAELTVSLFGPDDC